MAGRKVGLVLDVKTDRTLDAMSFVLGRTRSDLVTEGVQRQLASLSEPQRRSFDTLIRLVSERVLPCKGGHAAHAKRVQERSPIADTDSTFTEE